MLNVITPEAAGKYQVRASLTASRCRQANQNAFSYFTLFIHLVSVVKPFLRSLQDLNHIMTSAKKIT